VTIATTHISAREFMALPEDPEKTRYELVNGEVIVSPAPTYDHAYALTKLLVLLCTHIDDHDLGPIVSDIDTYFDMNDVRRPDLLYFEKARLTHTRGRYPDAPPDLCVEFLSPSNAAYDRKNKFELYERAGVTNYWIIDPMSHAAEAHTLVNGNYVEAGRGANDDVVSFPPFTDLNIPLRNLWRQSISK
jgi:Uma2 family endonuclease